MQIRVYLLIFLMASSFTLAAQTLYSVGTATESIEPNSSIVSVALSGYGSPKEGRFSLSWDSVATLPITRSIAGYNGKLYVVNDKQQLLEGILKGNKLTWKNISGKRHWKLITTTKDGLIGLSANNELFRGTSNPTFSWQLISKLKRDPAFFVVHGQHFLKKEDNSISIGLLNNRKAATRTEKDTINFINIVSNGTNLYGINKGDSLYRGEIIENKLSWVQIGRNNKLTFKAIIKSLLLLNGNLYGVSDENKLLKARHYSDNSLSVSALAIKSANKAVVIVGLDLVNFNSDFIRSIKKELYKRCGLPESAILINASHTHFAPVTFPWLTWEPFYNRPDARYLAQIKAATIKVVENAIETMKPSRIYFVRGTTNIGRNRRPANNPDKPYDNTLDLLRIESGKHRSILFLTGCHPVLVSEEKEIYQLSANYPGVARTILKKKLDLSDALFLQGTGADINPRNKNYQITGSELANDVAKIYEQKGELLSGKIEYVLDTIQIPVTPWNEVRIEEFRAENVKQKGKLEADKNIRWADLMLQQYQTNAVRRSMPEYVQMINIGQWKMVGLSREVVTEYGPAIRKLWPEKIVTVAGYCNDVSSYLPNSWHVKEGVYEGNESFYWYGQPALFPENTFQLLIEKMKSLTTN